MPSAAQVPSSSPRRMILDQVRYKPKEQGPLLWVGSTDILTYSAKDEDFARQKLGTMTVQQYADLVQRRLIHSGNLSAIVPATMRVIPKTFGTPDPFAGMRRSERLQILLSLFTREQWRMAGSERGIGVEELTKEQRPLFDSLFTNGTVTVQHARIDPAPDGRGEVYSAGDGSETVKLTSARLRLSRRVHFTFHALGKEGLYSSSTGDQDGFRTTAADGTVIKQYLEMSDDVDPNPDTTTTYSYGVPVIETVPNRLKPGQLDLDMPSLSTPILLDGSAQTLGELLSAIAKVTRLDLTVDKRYADLAVSYRITPGGQSVYAGDLLKILCRAVNGTFRRLNPPRGEPIFLLTDDVEGLGTRFARLDRWARKPHQEREEALAQATKKCAAQTPLEFIGFVPGDPLALPEQQQRRIDDSYRGIATNPAMTPADLSPALRKELDRIMQTWATMSEPITLQKDSFDVGTELNIEIVLQDRRAFPLPTGFSNLGSSFLSELASAQRKLATPPAPISEVAHPKMPAAIKRRVFIAPLPSDTASLTALLKLVRQKGFTEIWFAVPPTDDVPKRLQQAIASGKSEGISVGAVVSWLLRKEADEQAQEDRNILGETGSEWYQDQGIKDVGIGTTYQEYYRTRFVDRILPGSDVTLRRGATIARVPNLCALVLQDTAAPGWAGWSPYREPEERLGYSLETRLACIRAQGFDPIDVAQYPSYAGVDIDWGDWEGNALQPVLAEFRRKRNTDYMRRVFTRLRGIAPGLPLYVSDPGRASQETMSPYFVRWEKPDALPRIDASGEDKDVYAAASALAKDPLLACTTTIWATYPRYFWENAQKQVNQAKHWGGFVWNLERDPMPDVLKFLVELPDDTLSGTGNK